MPTNNKPMGRPKLKTNVLKRLLGMLFKFYPVLLPLTIVCIVFTAITSAIPALFLQKVTEMIEFWQVSGDWNAAKAEILPQVMLLVAMYAASLVTITLDTQLMAYITQGFLCKMRRTMFDRMQDLPIKYFDTHKHGDIMSYYTNDIDTLRQLVAQSLPTLIRASIIVLSVFFIMLYFSIWLTLLLMVGVVCILLVTKKVGGGSAKYFLRLQKSVASLEGFVQEMMNGQKVIKVFNHEEKCEADFDRINTALFEDSRRANAFANMLGPIIMNIGNVMYVIVAMVGGLLLVTNVPNLSLSGLAFGVDIIVPFLSMTKQFTGNINQVSQQINSIVMGMAGAERIFELMDEVAEPDDGYVTLVNTRIDENGNVTETKERTGQWAWKHPHSADGSVTYTPLCGDVRMFGVDFAYEEGKNVLHDVTLYAEPGQKVAFVGATGAGKTTITNLINRFYDIADGKVRYDGININKIRKSDLRRSLGSFCRRPTSLRVRLWTTSATESWMPPTRNVSARQSLRALTTLSRVCRTATRPSLPTTVPTSRRVNVS